MIFKFYLRILHGLGNESAAMLIYEFDVLYLHVIYRQLIPTSKIGLIFRTLGRDVLWYNFLWRCMLM